MACDFKPSVKRMKEKLDIIRKIANDSLCEEVWKDKDGQKYMCLAKAIGKISGIVRDHSNVREFWYAKFVEEGRLVQPEEKRCDWDSNRCGSGCLVYDDNLKMSKTIVTLKSEIEALKNGDHKEVL